MVISSNFFKKRFWPYLVSLSLEINFFIFMIFLILERLNFIEQLLYRVLIQCTPSLGFVYMPRNSGLFYLSLLRWLT